MTTLINNFLHLNFISLLKITIKKILILSSFLRSVNYDYFLFIILYHYYIFQSSVEQKFKKYAHLFIFNSLHSISPLYCNFEEMATHTRKHTRVLARARGGGPRACIYVYLLEERPLDDA